jgi:hypothetical protein
MTAKEGEGCLKSKILRPTHFLAVKVDKKGGEVIRPTAKKWGAKSKVGN